MVFAMRKVLLLFLIVASVLSGWAQPTPRPGQKKVSTPVLLPKGGSGLMPATAPSRSRSSDSVVQPDNNRQNNVVPPSTTAKESAKSASPALAGKKSEPSAINWISFEEAVEKSKTEKRKIVVDVFTDWCGWCKRMDQTTFTDPQVVEYVNANYYAVKFNAEQQKDINFKDKTYRFKRNGSRGYHELAAEWLNNRLGYPTIVFLDEELNLIQPIPGYQDASKFDTIIHYFGTNSHKSVPWETFERKYNE